MRRNALTYSFALLAALAAGCGSGSKTGSGSSAYTGVSTDKFDVAVVKPMNGFVTGTGIDCGIAGTIDKSACDIIGRLRTAGNVVLDATPAAGYRFRQWAGDCSGTIPTCTIVAPAVEPEPGSNRWYRVVAVFEQELGGGGEVASGNGRVYGYVKDAAATKIAGVTVALWAAGASSAAGSATTGAAGTYVIDVPPGTYTIKQTAGSPAAPAGLDVSVTVPAAGHCSGTGVTNSFGAGAEAPSECLVQVDLTTTAAPPAPAAYTITVGSDRKTKAGFGTTANLTCYTSTGAAAPATAVFTQYAGPTAVAVPSAPVAVGEGAANQATVAVVLPNVADILAVSANPPATTCPNGAGAGRPGSPSVGATGGNARIGCGVSNFATENRTGFLAINKQQAGEITFTFKCEVTDANGAKISGTTTVQPANQYTAYLGNSPVIVSKNSPDLSVAVTDPRNNASDLHYHGYARAPAGAIIVVDDAENRAAYDWVLCNPPTAMADGAAFAGLQSAWYSLGGDLTATPVCADGSTAGPGVMGDSGVVINGRNTAHPWFVGPASGTKYLWNRAALPTKVVVPISFAKWGGYNVNCISCHDPKWLAMAPGGVRPVDASGNPLWEFPSDPASTMAGAEVEAGPPEQFLEWKESKHNHIILDGMAGTHYSANCLPCHALGYATNTNGSFDETMKATTYAFAKGPAGTVTPWTFPDFTFTGTGPNLQFPTDPIIAAKANVQCESCHGPGGMGGSDAATCNGIGNDVNGVACTNSGGTSHSAPMSAKSCAYCHDGGHHGIYSQWRTERHSNLATAQSESDPAGSHKDDVCAACHTAQGFVQYAASLKKKTGGEYVKGTTAVKGINRQNVEPITCQVCHEPHSLELRIGEADAAGLKLGAASSQNGATNDAITLSGLEGGGALCMACHNSRRKLGLQQDGTTVALSSWRTTHDGPQTDVYLNLSGFWFGTTPPATNVHNSEWFKNSCVDCHVTLIPAGYPTVANHTFDANQACASCHGSGLLPDGRSAKGLQFTEATEEKIRAIAAKVMQKLNALSATTPLVAGGFTIQNNITELEIEDGTLVFKLEGNPVAIRANVDGITRLTGGAKLVTYAADGTGANQKLAHVLYNVAMVQIDKSGGLHNIQGVPALLDVSLANVPDLL